MGAAAVGFPFPDDVREILPPGDSQHDAPMVFMVLDDMPYRSNGLCRTCKPTSLDDCGRDVVSPETGCVPIVGNPLRGPKVD